MIAGILWGLVFAGWAAVALLGWPSETPLNLLAYAICAWYALVECLVAWRREIDRWDGK